MMSIENELKKQFEELKNNSVLEKNHLHNVYTEEKLELTKVKNILFLDFIFFFFCFNFSILSKKTCIISLKIKKIYYLYYRHTLLS